MKSIWKETAEPEKRPSLAEDIETEVAVMGGGMAGILTAWFLHKAGKKVVVLEAGRIGSGQTGNTTAKITSQHGLIYKNMITDFGEEMAGQYLRANQRAVLKYGQIVEENSIDCDFKILTACLYSRKNGEMLEQEAEAVRSLGVKCRFIKETELPFPVAGAVEFPDQAQLHPLKFLAQISRELEVYENTRVVRLEQNTLFTDRHRVKAQKVVFATHFPFINRPGYYFMRMHQERSYLLALKDAMEVKSMYLGVDEDENWSLRQQGELLLFGGESHRTGENTAGGRYDKLREAARSLWPGCAVQTLWSAQDCMTQDGIPYIGQFSAATSDWYVATGFGKWGMSHSMAAAERITDLILGLECSGSEVFSPQRFHFSESAASMVEDGLESIKGLSLGHLVPGEKPRCSHLGCQLEENPDEKSWECPCHGSRFDQYGKRTEGPAQEDLAQGEVHHE